MQLVLKPISGDLTKIVATSSSNLPLPILTYLEGCSRPSSSKQNSTKVLATSPVETGVLVISRCFRLINSLFNRDRFRGPKSSHLELVGMVEQNISRVNLAHIGTKSAVGAAGVREDVNLSVVDKTAKNLCQFLI